MSPTLITLMAFSCKWARWRRWGRFFTSSLLCSLNHFSYPSHPLGSKVPWHSPSHWYHHMLSLGTLSCLERPLVEAFPCPLFSKSCSSVGVLWSQNGGYLKDFPALPWSPGVPLFWVLFIAFTKGIFWHLQNLSVPFRIHFVIYNQLCNMALGQF